MADNCLEAFFAIAVNIIAEDGFHFIFLFFYLGFQCIAVTGGFTLFSASATTYIVNPAFLVKLGMLVPTALVFHVIVQWRSRRWGRTPELPGAARLAGLVELLLWLAVVTAAVEIPSY